MNAFGIDISIFDSNNGLMNFGLVAEHEPRVSFIAIRSNISWGYQDKWFPYHWDEVGKMDRVGRMAYHVLYPGEDVQRQADNWFNTVGPVANWEHDRLVIDWELTHNQSKRRITDAIKQMAAICKARTGRYPVLYTRRLLLRDYTYPSELTFLDLWLAQYRWALPYPLYTPEYPPPPDLPPYFNDWLIHQTGDKGKPIGTTGNKYYMDYNRWNGDEQSVMDYFGFTDEVMPEPEPLTLEERVADNTRRIEILENK